MQSVILTTSSWAVTLTFVAFYLRAHHRLVLVARACHELRGPLFAVQLGLHGLVGEPVRLAAIELELARAGRALDDLAAAPAGGRGRNPLRARRPGRAASRPSRRPGERSPPATARRCAWSRPWSSPTTRASSRWPARRRAARACRRRSPATPSRSARVSTPIRCGSPRRAPTSSATPPSTVAGRFGSACGRPAATSGSRSPTTGPACRRASPRSPPPPALAAAAAATGWRSRRRSPSDHGGRIIARAVRGRRAARARAPGSGCTPVAA